MNKELITKEQIIKVMRDSEESLNRNVGMGCNYETYLLPPDYILVARKILELIQVNEGKQAGVMAKHIEMMKTALLIVTELGEEQAASAIQSCIDNAELLLYEQPTESGERGEVERLKGEIERLKDKIEILEVGNKRVDINSPF